MKSSLTTMLLFLFFTVLVGCSTTNGTLPPLSSVRPNVAKEGTLANPALAQDASLAIRNIMGGNNSRIIKFVIQQPVGMPGKKAWRELWVYDPAGIQNKFIMTFQEDGQGSADFTIQKMQN